METARDCAAPAHANNIIDKRLPQISTGDDTCTARCMVVSIQFPALIRCSLLRKRRFPGEVVYSAVCRPESSIVPAERETLIQSL